MASNDQWPPVAATGRNSGKNRSNINLKKPTKEHQQQVLTALIEMFQSTLESEVILSVAYSCHWELQACIDALIAISSTVESDNKVIEEKESFVLVTNHSSEPKKFYVDELKPDFVKMDKDELQLQQEELKKFEKLKKKSIKNRMGSFRGNISKLNSTTAQENQQESMNFDSIWDLPVSQSINGEISNEKFSLNNPKFVLPTMQQPTNPWTSDFSKVAWVHQSSKNLHPDTPTEEITEPPPLVPRSNPNSKSRNESEFCGLKVQYRTAGMESSSEDDDADVVIEEELNCTIPTSLPINVSELLSSSIQTPPRVSQSKKTTTITTASPPRTPKRSVNQLTLLRIGESIKNGEKIMIIMRGLPGSGKSTLARSLIVNADPSDYIFSTDDYFVALGRGIYKYDPTKIRDAHSKNEKRVFDALEEGKTPIIVDNTNLQDWEMRPYAAMAVKHGYIVELLQSDTSWAYNVNELARKNTHGVPKEKIREMLNRYEQGLTGSSLLDRFSLKYEPMKVVAPNNIESPALVSVSPLSETSKIEDPQDIAANSELSSRSCSAFVDYQREIKSPDSLKKEENKGSLTHQQDSCDNFILQALGAIGSERKGSLVPPEIITPTSEKEDTNMEIEQSLLNNADPNSYSVPEKSPVSLAEIAKQDEEFGKEIKREEEILMSKSGENDGMITAVHDFLNGLAQGYTDTEDIDVLPVVEARQSTVVITEVFEEINREALNDSENNSRDISGGKEVEDDQEIAKIEACIEAINLESDIKKESIADEEMENISVQDKDLSIIDGENLLHLETEEAKEPISSKSTLGTIFNIIKTSILGNSFEEENSENGNEIELDKELDNFGERREDMTLKMDTKNETPEPVDTDNVIENPIAEIRAAINSTDSGIIVTEMDNDKIDDTEFHSLENNEFVVDEKHSFLSVLESSGSFSIKQSQDEEKSSAETQSIAAKATELSKEFEILDNINRITWRESPFPVDDLTLPKISLTDEVISKNVPKSNAETNTTYYDFNVVYVGGTSDPAYKVMATSNRYINEGLLVQKSEKPPLKLMLDKSSMTGDLFTREVNAELKDEDAKKNHISKLMELFPSIPKDDLIDIFEKADGDFDWTMELLLDMNSTDNFVKVPEDKVTEEDAVFEEKEEKEIFPLPQSSNQIVIDSCQEVVADELDEEALFTETLPKEIKTEVSNDTCSTSTPSPSRTNSIEDEKSTETDQVLELNLGFGFIRLLEEKFGNPDFHIPDGFVPVVQIKKSMAEELHACWIESMYQQLNARHEQLDQMIAKDAEFARSVERELELEEARASEQSEPNLDQIMDMELALAKYKNELKSIVARETPDDLAARLSRQMLHESLPDFDPDTFNEILKAHNGNFKEAFEIIEMNTGKSIVPCDTLKRQKLLMEKVKEEAGNLKEKVPIIVVRSEAKEERAAYKSAVATAIDSRRETHRQFSLKVQNYNKAAEAYRKGYPAVAAYYSQVARLHSSKIDAANAAAASAFVEAQSWEDEETLDLHHLFVSEALLALDEFIECHLNKLMKSNKRAVYVYIITGRGARSNNKTSKIKPAVSQRLISKNIKFSEVNPGCLKVTLYRKNGTD